MQVDILDIPGALTLKPERFGDDRGYFTETYNHSTLAGLGLPDHFVQDNESYSAEPGTLRGLHAQLPPFAQAKLVRVLDGRILDVIVDARTDSPRYGEHVTLELDAATGTQVFVPSGCLHGFLTLEPDTRVSYKVDAHYDQASDRSIAWDDPDLAIEWPVSTDAVILSNKDQNALAWREFASPFRMKGGAS